MLVDGPADRQVADVARKEPEKDEQSEGGITSGLEFEVAEDFR